MEQTAADKIKGIRARLQAADAIDENRKQELLGLLDDLSTEVGTLEETRREHAESISRFAELSAREATRSERDPHLVDLGLKGLTRSVSGFEASHPRLVEAVNSFCMMLAGIGI